MALKSGTVSRVGIGGSHVVRETSVPRCASHAQLTHSTLSEPAENFSAVHIGDTLVHSLGGGHGFKQYEGQHVSKGAGA